MSNFQKATRLKLRVTTPVGNLSVEQLWDLKQNQLAEAIKAYKQEVKKDDDLDFLSDDSSKVDEKTQLAFDVLKEIYLTKKQEAQDVKTAAEVKAHNARIMELIAQKQNQALESKSLEELQAMLKM